MVCDCSLTEEDIANGEMACGDDCLNRMLMIEWLAVTCLSPVTL